MFYSYKTGKPIQGMRTVAAIESRAGYGRPCSGRLGALLPLEKADNPTDTSADPTSLVVHGSLSSVDGKFGTLRGLGAGP